MGQRANCFLHLANILWTAKFWTIIFQNGFFKELVLAKLHKKWPMQSLETKSSRRETKSRDSITGNKEQKIWEGIVP